MTRALISLAAWGLASVAAAQVPPPSRVPLPPLPEMGRVDVGGGEPLTLGQVLSSVERHHPAIEGARQELAAAEGERFAAEGGFDTTLSGQAWMAPAGYYQWGRAHATLSQPTPLWGATFYGGWRFGRPFDADEGSDPGIPSYYRNYETLDGGELRAGVRVPLWRDGPIDGRRRRLWAAEHYRDAYAQYLEVRRLYVGYEAASAYWYWAAAGRKYRVAAELLDLAEARDAQIRAQVAAGAYPAIEALENRRVILARRRDLVTARRALEQAAISLSLYVRDRSGEPIVPSAARVPGEIPLPAPAPPPLADAVQRASRRHPIVQRYEALQRRQQVYVDYAENRFSPRVDVQLEASVDLGDGNDRQRSTYEDPVVEGSVLLEIPLQFRDARGGIQRERADLAALREEARLARDQIAQSVRDAHSALVAAHDGLALAQEAADVATAVARAERTRFELGATQLLIVNLREQYAAEAQKYLAEARAELQIAHARWRAVVPPE
ncbi:MAG: TolC family protein [Sandaracinaceae bacterium]